MPLPLSHRPLSALSRAALAALACTAIAGCAGHTANRLGRSEIAEGRLESDLAKLKQATEESPQNIDFRREYFNQREAAVNALVRQAEIAIEAADFDGARAAYDSVRSIDAANAHAASGIGRVEAAQRHWNALEGALALARKGELNAAIAKTQQVLSENARHTRATAVLKQLMRQNADRSGKELGIYPQLKQAYRKPVSLNLSSATLAQAFDALKQASGLNYVLDKDVRTDQRVTLSVTAKRTCCACCWPRTSLSDASWMKTRC